MLGRTPLRGDKCIVIYNGIEIDKFQLPRNDELRKRFHWSAGERLVGCLGNIRSAKGYDILLEAAALLKNRQPGFRFVIAGQGKAGLQERLLEQRAALGLEEDVEFLGFHDDPARFLSNLDIFLLPSTSEGFSIATIQAMAANLPVLATKSGGPEEIITHQQNGWLVEAGNPQAIAEALLMLSEDSRLCASLAANGRTHVAATFALDVMIDAYVKLYEQVL